MYVTPAQFQEACNDSIHVAQFKIQVSDEEAVGFRMFNLMLAINVRGMCCPESAHPKWGDVSRALASSKLRGSVLKGTLICNHYHGPFMTKKFSYQLKEAAEILMATCTDQFLDDLQDSYHYDVQDDTQALTREAWLEAPGIKTRLPQVSGMQCPGPHSFLILCLTVGMGE